MGRGSTALPKTLEASTLAGNSTGSWFRAVKIAVSAVSSSWASTNKLPAAAVEFLARNKW